MNKDLMRTGDTGFIKFRFMYRPEYLKIGTTILFREGRTKGLGVVSGVFPENSKDGTLNQVQTQITEKEKANKTNHGIS